MAISLSLSSKSKVDLALKEKLNNKTWDEAEETWDEASYTWDTPKIVLNKETKSNISLSLESK